MKALIILYFLFFSSLLMAEEQSINFSTIVEDVCYQKNYDRVEPLFTSTRFAALIAGGGLNRFCQALFQNAFETKDDDLISQYKENYSDKTFVYQRILHPNKEPLVTKEKEKEVLLAPQLFTSLDPIRSENILNQAYELTRNNNIGALILINKTGQCILQKRDIEMQNDPTAFWSLMVNYPRHSNQKNSIRSPIISTFYAIDKINSYLRTMINATVSDAVEKTRLLQWLTNKNLSKDIFIVTGSLDEKKDPCSLSRISFKEWLITKAATETLKGNELYNKIVICSNSDERYSTVTPEMRDIYQELKATEVEKSQEIIKNSGASFSLPGNSPETGATDVSLSSSEEILNYRFLSSLQGRYESSAVKGEDPRSVNIVNYMSPRGQSLFLADWTLMLNDCLSVENCQKIVPNDPRKLTDTVIKMLNNYLDVYYLLLLSEVRDQVLTNFYSEKRFVNACPNINTDSDIKSVSLTRELAIERVNSFSTQVGREIEKSMQEDIIFNTAYAERDNEKFYSFALKKYEWREKENQSRIDSNLRRQLEERKNLGQKIIDKPN